jgi:hypothetical protein
VDFVQLGALVKAKVVGERQRLRIDRLAACPQRACSAVVRLELQADRPLRKCLYGIGRHGHAPRRETTPPKRGRRSQGQACLLTIPSAHPWGGKGETGAGRFAGQERKWSSCAATVRGVTKPCRCLRLCEDRVMLTKCSRRLRETTRRNGAATLACVPPNRRYGAVLQAETMRITSAT